MNHAHALATGKEYHSQPSTDKDGLTGRVRYPELRPFILDQPQSTLKALFDITEAIACGKTYLELISRMK